MLVFDPLDGSSNIDVNINVGTIFSILRRKPGRTGEVQLDEILQPGSEQVAAGYFLYGTSTMLVYTTGQGVHGSHLIRAWENSCCPIPISVPRDWKHLFGQ